VEEKSRSRSRVWISSWTRDKSTRLDDGGRRLRVATLWVPPVSEFDTPSVQASFSLRIWRGARWFKFAVSYSKKIK
jgi:hypothetical protein